MTELIVFIGVQGSGKSSFYRERFACTHVHVSKDNFPNNRNPQRRQMQLIDDALGAGQSAVVDNTNATVTDRASLIAAGRAHGARVTGFYFVTSAREALERNARREGRARVPDIAIFATLKRLERPTLAEGFDALYHVRLQPEGTFDVTPAP